MSEKPDISELMQLAYVGLLGANKEIEKVLKDFHEEHDKPSHNFLFLEYLLHQPLHKEEEENKIKENINNTWIIHPFLYRKVEKAPVMIRPEEAKTGITFKFYTDEDLAKANLLIQMNHAPYTKLIYRYWSVKQNADAKDMDFIDIKIDPGKSIFFSKKPFIKKDMEEKIKNSIANIPEEDNVSKESFRMLYGIIHPYFASLADEEKISSLYIPIASSTVFYGNLWLVPHFELLQDEKTINQLVSKVFKCIEQYYVPALALIHEHFYEKLVSNQIKKFASQKALTCDEKIKLLWGPYVITPQSEFAKEFENYNITYKNPFCRRRSQDKRCDICFKCPFYGWQEASDNVVEKYLHKLLQDRNIIGETEYIEKSLFFKTRLYTAPEMLNLIERFLKPSKAKLKKDGEYLPSVLVVAPPGAGKEFMARLFKLFSDCYNRGEIYRLNMASLKPSDIAPVAMVGGEITWEKSIYQSGKHQQEGIPRDLLLIGILQQIRAKTHYEFQEFFSSVDEGGLIQTAHKRLNYLNYAVSNAIKDKEKRNILLEEQLKKKRECLIGLIKELDGWLKELLGKEHFKGKIEKFEKLQNDIEHEEKELAKKLEVLKGLEKAVKERENRIDEKETKIKWLEKHNEQLGSEEEVVKIKQKIDESIKTLKQKKEEEETKLKDAKSKTTLDGVMHNIDELDKLINEVIVELKTLHEKQREEFKKGINKFLAKLNLGEKLIIKELFGRFPTIIFDELNSLDIDSQGVLLRFIENAEITPIGGYEDKMWVDGEIEKEYKEFLTDCLVVGLMNEDPEEITREKAVSFLKQKDSYISGLLGDLLYEHILKIRRLRPDLRQRMMRNGKFKIPELAKHRGDIPVIFYMEVNSAKEDFFPNSVVRIKIDALEYLMRHELDWPENVRLLQTLAKKVMEVVYEDKRYKGEPLPTINGKDLIIIRVKHVKEAMKEIDMEKEEGLNETPV